MIKRARKIISISLIIALLLNSNISSFAQLVLPGDINNSGIINFPTYSYYNDNIANNIRSGIEANTGNHYVEEIIWAKYAEILNNLQSDIYNLGERISSLDRREDPMNMHVNSTIVEPASVRANATALQVRLGQEEANRRNLLRKLQRNQNDYGRIYTIDALLFGKEGTEPQELSAEDQAYYDEHKEEIEAFEEEYVHYLVSELMKSTKREFLFHVYKIIPYIKTKTDERWNRIKQTIKTSSINYAKYLQGINDTEKWVKDTDVLLKMLPFIKGEMGESNYTALLATAHNNLQEAMQQCQNNNKCDNYLNLLSKEIFFYIPGEERKYQIEIEDGYYHGVRAAILDFGKRTNRYEYYNGIMLTVLTNYLTLKQYSIIEDIISTQEWAEDRLKESPINGLDIFFASTYVKAGLSLGLCHDIMTYFPDMPSLPSRKGEYKMEDGTVGNIWWDLGEMLKDDGSRGADAVLEKEINKINKIFDSTRGAHGEDVLKLGNLGILKVSALVNVKKNVPGAEEKAKDVMNTSYGDLSLEEEKEIDKALARRYPNLQTRNTLGAVITPAGETYKAQTEQRIKKWNNLGIGVDVVLIVISFVELAIGAVKLIYNGCKLGVGFYRAFKAARMMQQSAKQVAYIRKNMEAIRYFKTWKAGGKAWVMGLNANRVSAVPAPAVRQVVQATPARTITDQKVLNSLRRTKSGVNNNLQTPKYTGKSSNGALNKIRAKKARRPQIIMWEPVEPRSGVIQIEKPATLTATVGEGGGGGAVAAGSAEAPLTNVPVNPDDVLIGRGNNGYYITAERDAIYQAEIDAMNKASAQAVANYRPNNLFKKSYNNMNWFERFVTNTQANGSYLWHNMREAFTAVANNPGRAVTSAGVFGVGEAPAVEARVMGRAPFEITVPAAKSTPKIWDVPINLYNPKEIAPSIPLSKGKAVGTRARAPKFRRKQFTVAELRDFLNTLALAALNANKAETNKAANKAESNLNPDASIIAHFHQYSKEDWRDDRTVVEEQQPVKTQVYDDYAVPLSSLVEEAEAWGMPHDNAMQIAYGQDKEKAIRELQEYVAFVKMGENKSKSVDNVEYDEGRFIKGKYKGEFNNNTRPLRVLVISDDPFEESDFEVFIQNEKVQIDFARDYWEGVTAMQLNNGKYDIIFTDTILTNVNGAASVKYHTDVLKYVQENNLNIPVILFSTIYKPDKKMLDGFDGFLSASTNDFDNIVNYASNFFDDKPVNYRTFYDIFFSTLVVGAVVVLSVLLGDNETAGATLAASPLIFGGLQNSFRGGGGNSLSRRAQGYLNLRKNFDREIFEGPALTKEEEENLERILGKEFFDLWQKYYNRELRDYALANPQDIEILARYSNRYETTLRSHMNSRFAGTNPLYIYAMKTMTEQFEKDLNSGRSFEDAVTDMGISMYIYHKKIMQIKAFFKEKKTSKRIIWGVVETPWEYVGIDALQEGADPRNYKPAGTKSPDKITFGILSNSNYRSYTLFNDVVYGEYWDDYTNLDDNRPKSYEGINLSYPEVKRIGNMPISGNIKHPVGVDLEGHNNIAKCFQFLQSSYNEIAPLIAQVQKGKKLTQDELDTIHKTIAKISYIFTNVKPFYRGSASANLIIVYGLYDMLGIQAPRVKMNRELDLSAFALAMNEYQDEWLNLFAEPFDNTPTQANTTKSNKNDKNYTDFFSAKLLFLDWYRNKHFFETDVKRLENDIPSGFEETNVLYRGMTLSSYRDLLDILLHGVTRDKVSRDMNSVYFTKELNDALYFSIQYNYGYVPVLVKIKGNGNLTNERWYSFPQGVGAEDILEVLVWAQMNGKTGWWKAGLNENGDVILSATDNMETESAYDSPKPFGFKDYILPVLTIGFSIYSLISGFGSPFALAALPVAASIKPSQYSKSVLNFFNLRQKFDEEIFSGPELTEDETQKLKDIVDENFFDTWYRYYRRDLGEYVAQNPEETEDLAQYSNRYENGLESMIKYRFNGANPLFFYTMKNWTDSFAQALADGKNIGKIITGLGKEMYGYHKKVNQIKTFLDEKQTKIEINWSRVAKPKGYRFLSTIYNYSTGFGVLKDTQAPFRILRINRTSFAEYLSNALNHYQHPQNNTYKGIDLVSLFKIDRTSKEVNLQYPAVHNSNGGSNIDKAFAVLQEDWEKIKPLTEKYQSGQKLNEADIKLLHETIAEMSYIFTNVVPFYRGSASMNLIMVYALYQAAGISAPKVRNGRALDLEAFVTSPEQYIANWTNLFVGNFEIIEKNQQPVNEKTENILEGANKPSPKRRLISLAEIKKILHFVMPVVGSAALSFLLKDASVFGVSLATIPLISGGINNLENQNQAIPSETETSV